MSTSRKCPSNSVLVGKYTAGRSAVDLSREYGVSRHTIQRWLKESGAAIRGPSDLALTCCDVDTLVRDYNAGATTTDLSLRFGVSRKTITKWLRAQNVTVRNNGAARLLTWNKQRASGNYQEYVERTCGSAWRAAKGRIKTVAEKIKLAQAMAGKLRGHGGKYELELYSDIESIVGVGCVAWQYPIGGANVDLAIPGCKVVVEVMRGTPYKNRGGWQAWSNRLAVILASGWSVFVVYSIPKYNFKKGIRVSGSRYDLFDRIAIAKLVAKFSSKHRKIPAVKVVNGIGKATQLPG